MAIFKIKDGFSIVDSNNVESQQISGVATAISSNPSDSNIPTEKAVADAIAEGGGGGDGAQVYEPQNPGYTDTPTYDGTHAYSVNTCGALLPATIKSFTFWPYSLNPYAVSGFRLWVAIYDIDNDFNLLSAFTWDDSKHPATDWAYWPRTFDFDSPIKISRDGRYRVVIYIYAPGASGQVVMTIGNGSSSTFPPFQKYTMPSVSGGYASAPAWTGNYSSASGQVRIPWFQLNSESTNEGGGSGEVNVMQTSLPQEQCTNATAYPDTSLFVRLIPHVSFTPTAIRWMQQGGYTPSASDKVFVKLYANSANNGGMEIWSSGEVSCADVYDAATGFVIPIHQVLDYWNVPKLIAGTRYYIGIWTNLSVQKFRHAVNNNNQYNCFYKNGSIADIHSVPQTDFLANYPSIDVFGTMATTSGGGSGGGSSKFIEPFGSLSNGYFRVSVGSGGRIAWFGRTPIRNCKIKSILVGTFGTDKSPYSEIGIYAMRSNRALTLLSSESTYTLTPDGSMLFTLQSPVSVGDEIIFVGQLCEETNTWSSGNFLGLCSSTAFLTWTAFNQNSSIFADQTKAPVLASPYDQYPYGIETNNVNSRLGFYRQSRSLPHLPDTTTSSDWVTTGSSILLPYTVIEYE